MRLVALLAAGAVFASPWSAAGQDTGTADPPVASPPITQPPVVPPEGPVSDGRRVSGRFVSNFGRDLAAVVSRASLAPLLITAGAAGAGAFLDDDLKNYFSKERRAK